MKYLLIIAVMLLTACGGGGGGSDKVAHAPVVDDVESPLLVGDSRCVHNKYIPNRDCHGGRQLIGVTHLDNKYKATVIALGYNDMYFGVDVLVYKAHLEHLIAGYDGRVVCVLEATFNYHFNPNTVAAFRQAMIDVCPEYIDPNIDPLDPDRTHYNDYNYQQMRDAYEAI